MGLVTSPPPQPLALHSFDSMDASACSLTTMTEVCWIEQDMDDSASTAAPELDTVDDMVIALPEPNSDDCKTKVYPIPVEITDSRLEECLLQTESTLGGLFKIIVDRAARTITFIPRAPPKLMPGPPAYGTLGATTFNVPFPEKRAKMLKDAWPDVALTLYDYSISCDLSLSELRMHVSTTPSLKDPCMIEKARHLLQLLSTSLIPPSMALEIFKGVRQHETINIGFQQGGICSSFGINKDDYLKRWECLFSSLNALSKATCCHIFLDENTFTAVTAAGSSVEGIFQLKTVVQDFITKNVSPLMDDLHAKVDTIECFKSGPLSSMDGMLEVCSLYTLLPENRVSKLQESLPKLKHSLKHYGISYTLDENYLILSTTKCTKDPDIIDKAWKLLELLSTTHVPASLAIELLDCMHTCLIKIGYQEGGLSKLFGVKKEDYSKRLECLRQSLQILAERKECNVFLNDNTVAAVGLDSVRMVKLLVENCIRHNVCPGTVIRDYNCLSEGMIRIEDPHEHHMEIHESTRMVLPELTSFCVFLNMEQGTLVEKDWTSVEACLDKHGFSCKLVPVAEYCYYYMIVTKTINSGELDITNKIWDFLKLLSNDLEASKAIGILNGSMDYDFVPIGYSNGGVLCTQFEVTEEEYAEKVWPRLESELQRFAIEVNVEFVIMPGYIAVIGPKNVGEFRGFVYMCFICARPLLSMGIGKWSD